MNIPHTSDHYEQNKYANELPDTGIPVTQAVREEFFILFEGMDPEEYADLESLPWLSDALLAQLIFFGNHDQWEHYASMRQASKLSLHKRDFFEEISALWHTPQMQCNPHFEYPHLFRYIRTRFLSLQTAYTVHTLLSDS